MTKENTPMILSNTLNVTQRQIHRELGVSLSWINTIVNSLYEAGITGKGERRRIELEDPYALLGLLSWQRPLQPRIQATVRLELTEIADVKEKVRETCRKANLDYAFTAFSGVTRYLAHYLNFPTIHTYTDNPERLSQLLSEGCGPLTTQILKVDYLDILRNATTINGFKRVDPVQVVIDLFCLGSAGRDAATKLYERIRDEQRKTA